MFKEALYEIEGGLIINGQIINNLRYSDDTVLLSDSTEGLQRIIERVIEVSEEFGLKLEQRLYNS